MSPHVISHQRNGSGLGDYDGERRNPEVFETAGDETTWGDSSLCDYYVPAELL